MCHPNGTVSIFHVCIDLLLNLLALPTYLTMDKVFVQIPEKFATPRPLPHQTRPGPMQPEPAGQPLQRAPELDGIHDPSRTQAALAVRR